MNAESIIEVGIFCVHQRRYCDRWQLPLLDRFYRRIVDHPLTARCGMYEQEWVVIFDQFCEQEKLHK